MSYNFVKVPVFYIQSNSVPFDPPIVESMGELNQILSVHHITANARRVRSPYSEQSTSSSSEPDTPEPTSSKPKLSDALSHLAFSPKRPRSPALPPRSASPAQLHGLTRGGMSASNRPETQHPPRSHQITARPSSLRVPQVDAREGEPTPHPRKVLLRTQDVTLEFLITTLRSHMSRLTSELSSHKTLLDELRTLREADKNTLRQKVCEVDLLRQEVEKVAGEVEVLKGVVEEGLRERRERNLSQPHGEPRGHVMAVGEGEDGGNDEVERGTRWGRESQCPRKCQRIRDRGHPASPRTACHPGAHSAQGSYRY